MSADAPEDVRALFESANVKGIPYFDFSASRREYRAAMRHRAAMLKRDAEAKAKAEAEQAAAEAERGAREAAEAARFHAAQARRAAERHLSENVAVEEAARERALVQADQLSRRAAAERTGAARHAESLRAAEQAVRREALELSRARDQPRSLDRDPEPASTTSQQQPPLSDVPESDAGEMAAVRVPQKRDARTLLAPAEIWTAEDQEKAQEPPETAAGRNPVLVPELSASETAQVVDQYSRAIRGDRDPSSSADPASGSTPSLSERQRSPAAERVDVPETSSSADPTTSGANEPRNPPDSSTPSWIGPYRSNTGENGGRVPLRDTLQQSRAKVAARWFALRGLFDPNAPSEEEAAAFGVPEASAPVLAIYSVAGGVGKTSLAASLTRALAAQGERVLLVDTTERGVLPFYLGARELRPEVIRTFAPPSGSTDQPIHLVSYASDGAPQREAPVEDLAQRIKRDRTGFSRVVVDVASSATAVLAQLLSLGADVLVPVAPDMNSVISLPLLRRDVARSSAELKGHTEPTFLLTQFDSSQPLQLDIREVLQHQLGERLLPFAVRRSTAITEALAEGMTVVDYAPGEGIAKDFLQVASWVRTLAEPAREGLAQARWSER